jgi:hypothetical protein
MPFHPARLHGLLSRYFVLRQQDWSLALSEASPPRDAELKNPVQLLERASHAVAAAAAALPCNTSAHSAARLAKSALQHAEALSRAYATQAKRSFGAGVDDVAPSRNDISSDIVDVAEARRKGEVRTGAFGRILRSKGFVWLAGERRADHVGEWGSAGSVLQLNTGGPWYASLPLDGWPSDEVKRQEIMRDFLSGIGDRCEPRQTSYTSH